MLGPSSRFDSLLKSPFGAMKVRGLSDLAGLFARAVKWNFAVSPFLGVCDGRHSYMPPHFPSVFVWCIWQESVSPSARSRFSVTSTTKDCPASTLSGAFTVHQSVSLTPPPQTAATSEASRRILFFMPRIISQIRRHHIKIITGGPGRHIRRPGPIQPHCRQRATRAKNQSFVIRVRKCRGSEAATCGVRQMLAPHQ